MKLKPLNNSAAQCNRYKCITMAIGALTRATKKTGINWKILSKDLGKIAVEINFSSWFIDSSIRDQITCEVFCARFSLNSVLGLIFFSRVVLTSAVRNICLKQICFSSYYIFKIEWERMAKKNFFAEITLFKSAFQSFSFFVPSKCHAQIMIM